MRCPNREDHAKPVGGGVWVNYYFCTRWRRWIALSVCGECERNINSGLLKYVD